MTFLLAYRTSLDFTLSGAIAGEDRGQFTVDFIAFVEQVTDALCIKIQDSLLCLAAERLTKTRADHRSI